LVTQEGFGGSVERVPCTGSEGAVIGPKGQRIRAIAKETGARLEVQTIDDREDENFGGSECVIRGSPPEVAAAARAVREIVAMDREDREYGQGRGSMRGGFNEASDYADFDATWDDGRGRGGVRDWDNYTRPMRNPPLPFGYDEDGRRGTPRDGRVKRRESSGGGGGARRARRKGWKGWKGWRARRRESW
jgi:hypothetical protein